MSVPPASGNSSDSPYGAPQQGSPYGAPQQGSPYGAPQQGSAYGAPQQGSAYGAPQQGSPYGAPQQGSPYAAPQQGYATSPYGQQVPQQKHKRRGIKRMIFGGLGVLVNGVGLFVLPPLLAVLFTIISLAGEISDFETTTATSTTVQTDAQGLFVLVPQSSSSTTCSITGSSVRDVQPPSSSTSYEKNGETWVVAAQVTTDGSGDPIDISCPDSEGIGYVPFGFGGLLGGGLVGFLIPVILGTISMALLIWGIVAFVRSKPKAF